ncbi:MAG: vWA domain-containing protein, partial [Planctomycetota bacterium]
METILRWLAQWHGIAPEPGSELQFELANFPSGGLGLLVLLGCALAVLGIALVYRRDGHHLTNGQRLVLGGLRALAVLAVVLLLLEPNLVTVKRETRPGHTILLVDTSQSMTHLDAWRRPEVQPAADGWRALGVSDLATATRLQLVKALLAHGDGELVKKLAAKNQVQLYSFAGSLDQLPLLPPPAPKTGPDGQPLPVDPLAPPPVPQLDLGKLVADGRSSNLGGALRTALDKSRSAEIAAVVFVSDGRRNAGPQAAEIARLLNQRKIPHTFVLGAGDPSETQTVQLTRFEAPAKVFQKDPFELKANVSAQGYGSIQVTAKLVRIDDKGATQEVRTQPVTLGGEAGEVVIEWKEITADAPGRFLYRTEIVPPDGEPVVAERHHKQGPVEVLGETMRVLLVAGSANHEFQILRNLLIRDKTIDVSCWLQSADPKFPQDGDEPVRIEQLPAERVEFDPYDVVVLIDPDHSKLTPRFCEHLQQHVVTGGCGLWWIAGEKYSLEAMRQTSATWPVAELLPIVPDLEFAERGFIGLGKAFVRVWPWALAPEGDDGLGAKITRIGEGRDESRLLWGRLPGFRFFFPVSRLKPAAMVLAEHTSPDFRRAGRGMPMLAMQNVGAGRVVFTGNDETYRWRSLYEHAYNRFWVNGLRYLFEGRLQAGNTRLKLLASDDKVELGDAIELTAEVKDETLQPVVTDAYAVLLEREGDPAETLQLVAVESVPGSYSLR